MIKLLNKSEINTKKSLDRKREVDEGVKLAKRVDTLREVHAQEEASLEKFRVETVRVINEEISTTAEKLDVLKKEVKELEEKKAEALKPLTEEWEKLEAEKDVIVADQEILTKKESDFREAEKQLDIRTKSLEDEEKRIESNRERADKLLLDASEKNEKAKTFLTLSEEKMAKADDYANKKSADIMEAENRIMSKEEKLNAREKMLNEREAELNDRDRLLKSQYEQLLVTKKRWLKTQEQ